MPSFGNNDIVCELGAEDHELVKACAAVHRDRRVDVIANLVLPAAGADVGRLRHREAEPDLRHGHAVLVEDDLVVGDGLGQIQVKIVDAAVVVDVELRDPVDGQLRLQVALPRSEAIPRMPDKERARSPA